MKATYGVVNEKPIMIYKDPKTDTSHLKKSHKGCCKVYRNNSGELICEDGFEKLQNGELHIVYCNGDIIEEETFEDIRRRLNTQEEN